MRVTYYFNFIPVFLSCVLDMLRSYEKDVNGYTNQILFDLSSFFLKISFCFMHMNVSSECMHVYQSMPGAYGGQRGFGSFRITGC